MSQLWDFLFNDFVNIFEIYNVLLSRYEASESFYVSYLVVLKYYIENIILGSIVTNDSELQMKIKYVYIQTYYDL